MWDRWLERIQARPVKVFYSLPHPTINYEEEGTDTPRRIVRGRKVATTRFERELKKKKKKNVANLTTIARRRETGLDIVFETARQIRLVSLPLSGWSIALSRSRILFHSYPSPKQDWRTFSVFDFLCVRLATEFKRWNSKFPWISVSTLSIVAT